MATRNSGKAYRLEADWAYLGWVFLKNYGLLGKLGDAVRYSLISTSVALVPEIDDEE